MVAGDGEGGEQQRSPGAATATAAGDRSPARAIRSGERVLQAAGQVQQDRELRGRRSASSHSAAVWLAEALAAHLEPQPDQHSHSAAP